MLSTQRLTFNAQRTPRASHCRNASIFYAKKHLYPNKHFWLRLCRPAGAMRLRRRLCACAAYGGVFGFGFAALRASCACAAAYALARHTAAFFGGLILKTGNFLKTNTHTKKALPKESLRIKPMKGFIAPAKPLAQIAFARSAALNPF